MNTKRPCGRADCGTSTAIDEETLTYGRGKLDDYGYWEFPCRICAKAFGDLDPARKVWPAVDRPHEGAKR